jgi:hypothetical protein
VQESASSRGTMNTRPRYLSRETEDNYTKSVVNLALDGDWNRDYQIEHDGN